MSKPYVVIKTGGNELADADFVGGLAQAIAAHQQTASCMLVHGGGRAISDWMQKADIQPQFKDGQRVTDAATLEIAEMVLSGQINKKLVLALSAAGVDAIGLSGIDRQMLQVEPWGEDMGDLVGRIVHVRAEVLAGFAAQNVVPVISPISVGPAGRYNVNADHAAGKVAGALQAEQVVFITNVPGVLVEDVLAPQLTDTEVQELIESGTIHGGMIPKVTAALDTLQYGAQQAVITNLAGFQHGTGTTLTLERISHA